MIYLPPLSPLLHLLNLFSACFIPALLIQYCSNTSVCYAWNFHLVLLLFSVWMNVMTYLSYISTVMAFFIPITGFKKKGMIWLKKLPPLYCLELTASKMNFICFFGHRKLIEWNKILYFFEAKWSKIGDILAPSLFRHIFLVNTWYKFYGV